MRKRIYGTIDIYTRSVYKAQNAPTGVFMRTTHLVVSVSVVLLGCAVVSAQQPPQRDPQAIVILQQSLLAMGGGVPQDSVLTGAITIVAGSKTETGSIRVLVRGLDQAAEYIETPDGQRAELYSRGNGALLKKGTTVPMSLELAWTSQPPDVPIFAVAQALRNADLALQYLGVEPTEGNAAHHIRLWNTFTSTPRLGRLAKTTVRDIWIDIASGLPKKVSYSAWTVSVGEVPLRVEVSFADYRSVSGFLYPFAIRKSANGTPWTTIQVQQVVVGANLTDSDFPVN